VIEHYINSSSSVTRVCGWTLIATALRALLLLLLLLQLPGTRVSFVTGRQRLPVSRVCGNIEWGIAKL